VSRVVSFVGALFLIFLSLPIASLFFALEPAQLVAAMDSPYLLQSLRTSLLTTGASAVMIVVLGTPLAYMLARYSFRGKALLSMLLDLPMVVPPTVAGIGLLMAFGRRGLLGAPLGALGISLSFSTAAVVMAQVFIAAPFFIRTTRIGFAAASPELELMARTMGANTWMTLRRITLPLVGPYMVSGLLTALARALGEFGASIMFAGNFAGRTQTIPIAIFTAMQSDLGVALVLADILLVISLLLMGIVRLMPLGKGVH
jgi:molybdate transport system permease protein